MPITESVTFPYFYTFLLQKKKKTIVIKLVNSDLTDFYHLDLFYSKSLNEKQFL